MEKEYREILSIGIQGESVEIKSGDLLSEVFGNSDYKVAIYLHELAMKAIQESLDFIQELEKMNKVN